MKKITVLLMALVCLAVKANVIKSPDGRIQVTLDIRDGQPFYQVNYDGKIVIGESPLGIITNIGDFRQRLTLKGVTEKEVKDSYDVRNIKQSHIDYVANEAIASFEQDGKSVMDITFRVSNRDVAFRYTVQPQKNR
ncbi:MAG: glycoside hydrolase family 97 N-terminal domain-containing protein, partial [Prevotella sp.]|nr:glycoside hydrolase family 97 N-terminal domain-containing protein [Prevotella sp.]